MYNERPIDRAFHEATYRAERWQALLDSDAIHGMRPRDVVKQLAAAMLDSRTLSVERSALYERFADQARQNATRVVEDFLRPLGFLDVDDQVRFADFEWLVRSLVLIIAAAADADVSDARLRTLVADSASFAPIGDALGLWVASYGPPAILRALAAIIESESARRDRLIETLLARAYPDRDLVRAIAMRALEHGDESVCLGCAAAAQQMMNDGSADAAEAGVEIYERSLEVARQRRFAATEARVMNEYALVESADADAQARTFKDVVRTARLLRLSDLEHVATNNWADARLRALESSSGVDAPAIARSLSEVIAELTRVTADSPSDNWRNACATWQLLAEAHAMEAPADAARILACGASAIDLATRSGDFGDRAHAYRRSARCLAAASALGPAIDQQTSALTFARLAVLDLDEAELARGLARLLVARDESAGSVPRLTLISALAQCRAALRVLGRLPFDAPALWSAKGETWWDIACLLERLGCADARDDAEAKALHAYATAGDDQQLGSIRRLIAERQIKQSVH